MGCALARPRPPSRRTEAWRRTAQARCVGPASSPQALAGVSGRLRVPEDALEGAPARGGEWAGACRLRTDAGLPRWSAGLCSGDLWRIA